jgi:hypothetical protein
VGRRGEPDGPGRRDFEGSGGGPSGGREGGGRGDRGSGRKEDRADRREERRERRERCQEFREHVDDRLDKFDDRMDRIEERIERLEQRRQEPLGTPREEGAQPRSWHPLPETLYRPRVIPRPFADCRVQSGSRWPGERPILANGRNDRLGVLSIIRIILAALVRRAPINRCTTCGVAAISSQALPSAHPGHTPHRGGLARRASSSLTLRALY